MTGREELLKSLDSKHAIFAKGDRVIVTVGKWETNWMRWWIRQPGFDRWWDRYAERGKKEG